MNKKTKLLLASIMSLSLCASTIFIASNNLTNLAFASRAKPVSLDCSYYFDEANGYTSLYELNVSRINSSNDLTKVKTWGTVTDIFYNKAGTVAQQFIQSTDKNGNVGATCLYGIDSAQVFPIGSVVSITSGTMTLFNGMSEMKNCVVTKDYDSNPSPVESMKINGLPTSTDSNFTSYRYMGTREVNLTNVTLGEITSSRQCYATLENSKQVLLFFNSISEQTAINNKITSIKNNGSKADVRGFVTYYSGSNSLQVLIRHTSDITEAAPEKTITSLVVTTDKQFYYMDEVKMSDFTATVYYDDETHSIVDDAYITNTVDTSTLGSHELRFAYEHNGLIFNDLMYINVIDTIATLTIENPVQYYTFNEEFIAPTVTGNSCLYSADVTSEVEFSGFESALSSEYIGSISAKYTNSAGKIISSSYLYYVSDVVSLEAVSPKLEFEIGEAFDYPTVKASFSYNPYTTYDVTNRVTFTGFDSSTAGKVTVYMNLGSHLNSYEVEIIDKTPATLYEYEVSISGIGTYATGNYGASGDFEYYRAVREYGYICKLIPLVRQSGCEETLGGALYNVEPIKDIDHITFKYKTSGSGSRSAKFYCGENTYDEYEYAITSSSFTTERTINLSSKKVNYFKFDSGDLTLLLESIKVYYSGLNTTHGSDFNYHTTGAGEYRIAPTTYSGTLVDGVSYVDVPTSFDTSTCTVLSKKRYTYYSYQYVYEHPEYVSNATITSPVDVCNYFEAFGCAPANYGTKSSFDPLRDGKTIPSVDEVNDLFGDDARCISKYTKTTGYATSVPYYGSKPTYYELDIDTNGQYRTSSRQAGRIVAWYTGFTGSDYGYGSQIVCTYTDDHYSTFKEYNNFGSFLSRFKAEHSISGSIRGNPTTLSN